MKEPPQKLATCDNRQSICNLQNLIRTEWLLLTVFEDVDKVAEMEEADFLEVLALFVRRRRAVLLTGEQIEGVLRAEESVVVEDFDGRHPVGVVVTSNLSKKHTADSGEYR